MRACIQRVSEASVAVDGKVVGQIGTGLLVLLGVTHDDTEDEARQLASKIANLRILDDEQGVMNLSLLDINEARQDAIGMLVVSQFTLYGDVRKGRRPSWVHAARPEHARPVLDAFVDALRSMRIPVATGEFGAHMRVALVNDGPVTIWLDSDDLRRPRHG